MMLPFTIIFLVSSYLSVALVNISTKCKAEVVVLLSHRIFSVLNIYGAYYPIRLKTTIAHPRFEEFTYTLFTKSSLSD